MLWGFANLVVAYLLICRVGDFDLRATDDVIPLGLGMLLLGLGLARRFGHFDGGNFPSEARAIVLRGTFRSLQNPNYRIWAAGALAANVGSWMQTHRARLDRPHRTYRPQRDRDGNRDRVAVRPTDPAAAFTGFAADHLDRRKLLICTQAAMGLLALGLGLLVVTGLVRLWHVYIFAFLLGCAAAFNSPARQVFVSELVDERDLPNAVGLNSTSFNAADDQPSDCRRPYRRRRAPDAYS